MGPPPAPISDDAEEMGSPPAPILADGGTGSPPASILDDKKCFGFHSTNSKCVEPTNQWWADEHGRNNLDSWSSKEKCESRKRTHDYYCGTDSKWCYADKAEDCKGTAPTPIQPSELM